MVEKLNKELADALLTAGDRQLEVIDPQTQRVYFLVDGETHRRAMEALRREQDGSAIEEGAAQMIAGEGKPLDQAIDDIRSRLGRQAAE